MLPTSPHAVHERAARKRQERLGALSLRRGQAVEPVLIDRVVDRLREVGLQFSRCDRDAVEEQDEVQAILVLDRVSQLRTTRRRLAA